MGSREALPSSRILSSSISSLSSSTSSRQASSQISKIYRQASTLFLTRRLPESLSTILPVVAPTGREVDATELETSSEPAPIAGALRTTRIKVWSLYLTILNAVVELDAEEGKQAFGTKEWRSLVKRVRDGEVWEEVVQNGYGGIEGDVDADVVINLTTLLLSHAPNQHLNQQRLESYLAASSHPNLDISARLHQSEERASKRHSQPSKSKSNSTDTPRDLNARVKILELYTLHILLKNNEWDYSREFITNSEILDEERREAFLLALQSLQEDQFEQEVREQEAQRQHEEQVQRDLEEAKQRRLAAEKQEQHEEQLRTSPKRPSSEVDYGIDSTHPQSTTNDSAKDRTSKPSSKPARKNISISRTSKPSVSDAKSLAPRSVTKRAGALLLNLRALLDGMTASLRANPMILLRTLAFIVALLLVFSRQDVKERVKRSVRNGWEKIRATAGMGVKVSYI